MSFDSIDGLVNQLIDAVKKQQDPIQWFSVLFTPNRPAVKTAGHLKKQLVNKLYECYENNSIHHSFNDCFIAR